MKRISIQLDDGAALSALQSVKVASCMIPVVADLCEWEERES